MKREGLKERGANVFNDNFPENSEFSTYLPSDAAANCFIQSVRSEIIDGYGFVPFLGAGFSVPSGIPTIAQLLEYLQRCICMALGADDKGTSHGEGAIVWNPQTDRWPPFVDRNRSQPGSYWVGEVYKRMRKIEQERSKEHAEETVNLDWLHKIHRLAYGAMAEWRAALGFLCKLTLPNGREKDPAKFQVEFGIGVGRQDIVDGCFREAMRNKRPCVNHEMLASMATILRTDLILTTNFDNLMERAFSRQGHPLEVLDVHLHDGLPNVHALQRSRCIVKMHGSLHSLRADDSLDGEPTEEELKTVRSYFAGPNDSGDEPRSKSHLIVMGVGAEEGRTNTFVADLLEHFKNLQVYWVCYSPKAVDLVVTKISHQRLKISGEQELDKSDKKAPRLKVIHHPSSGLLLLHLYQSLRKSLPAKGAVFPSTTRLARPPLPWSQPDYRKEECAHFTAGLKEYLKRDDPPRLLVAYSKTNIYGVASAAADLYRSHEERKNCIWIDLNDLYTADDVFEAFRESAYYRLGQADWTPLFEQREQGGVDKPYKGYSVQSEIIRLVTSSEKDWVLFLNGREKPGVNRGDEQEANGWLDKSKLDGTDNKEAFADLISHFVKCRISSNQEDIEAIKKIHVVLLLSSNEPKPGETESSSPILKELRYRFQEGDEFVYTELKKSHEAVKEEDIVNNVITWTAMEIADGSGTLIDDDEKKARRRYLQVLVSMQRPRHYSVLWSKSMCGYAELDTRFDGKRDQWIGQIEKYGLIRRLDGGFIWMQATYRQMVRNALKLSQTQLDNFQAARSHCGWLSEDAYSALKSWEPTKHQAGVHLGLSTWYRKVFDATGVAPAIFETIEHLYLSAESLIRYENSVIDPHEKDISQSTNEETKRILLAKRRVDTAGELLREHTFLIQTQSHPRNSLRRLHAIREFWNKDDTTSQDGARKSSLRVLIDKGMTNRNPKIKKAYADISREIAKLLSAAAEVGRYICREVGDDYGAYTKVKEYGLLTTYQQLSDAYPDGHPEFNVADKTLDSVQKTLKLALKKDTSEDRLNDWVRWHRWCSMLAYGTRNYSEAQKSIFHCLMAARNQKIIQPAGSQFSLDKGIENVNKELDRLLDWPLAADKKYKLNLEILDSLQVAAYIMNLNGHTLAKRWSLVRWRVSTEEIDAVDGKKILFFYEAASKLALKGLQFVEAIQNSGEPRVDHDFELLWCKSRLLMIAGMAKLSSETLSETSRHTMSYLSDAEACLGSSTPERGHADLALVELRRAEVRLHEAGTIEFPELTSFWRSPIAGDFASWVNARMHGVDINAELSWHRTDESGNLIQEQQYPNPISQMNVVKGLNLDPSGKTASFLNQVRAKAIDALRYLESAEPILRERRRNVWWTTWFFERKMCAISYLLWATVVEKGTPIPYLGLEEAAWNTVTEADKLMENTIRMVRTDVYRLAMVGMYYASCTRALQIRLLLDQSQHGMLVGRLIKMRDNLYDVYKEIGNTEAFYRKEMERIWLRKSLNELDEPLDRDVRFIIDDARERILNVANGIQGDTTTWKASANSIASDP